MTLQPAYGEPGGGGGGGGGVDTNDYIRVSESTTNTSIASGTPPKSSVVNFDTVDKNTNGDNFSLASEAIVVAEAGEYRIEYMITFALTVNTIEFRGSIEIDPNTASFAEKNKSVFWAFGDGAKRNSVAGFIQTTLVAGSKVRLVGQRDLGTAVSSVDRDFTHMSITRIRA